MILKEITIKLLKDNITCYECEHSDIRYRYSVESDKFPNFIRCKKHIKDLSESIMPCKKFKLKTRNFWC